VAAALFVIGLPMWVLVASLFVVDVTQYALVSRFGAVLRTVDEPGLHVKAPFDTIVSVDKSLTFSRPGQAEYLTVDKKNVMVETLMTWRIADPQRYLVTLATRAAADVRLADVLLGEVGAVLAVDVGPAVGVLEVSVVAVDARIEDADAHARLAQLPRLSLPRVDHPHAPLLALERVGARACDPRDRSAAG